MMYNTTDCNHKTEIVEKTKQTLETTKNNDTIYTTSKTYSDGTTSIEKKTHFSNKKESQITYLNHNKFKTINGL